jgi:hypothetical protein
MFRDCSCYVKSTCLPNCCGNSVGETASKVSIEKKKPSRTVDRICLPINRRVQLTSHNNPPEKELLAK